VIITLLQIVHSVCPRKNCENRSIISEDMDKSKVARLRIQACKLRLNGGCHHVRRNIQANPGHHFLCPKAGTAVACLSHRNSFCLSVRHTGGSVENGAS